MNLSKTSLINTKILSEFSGVINGVVINNETTYYGILDIMDVIESSIRFKDSHRIKNNPIYETLLKHKIISEDGSILDIDKLDYIFEILTNIIVTLYKRLYEDSTGKNTVEVLQIIFNGSNIDESFGYILEFDESVVVDRIVDKIYRKYF